MSSKFRSFLTLLAGVALGAVLTLSRDAFADKQADVEPPAAQDDAVSWEDARLFAEVFRHIRREYVESVDKRQLMQSAIRGMMASLDTHSTFLDTQEFDEIRSSTAGNYSGVGIELKLESGALKILRSFEGSSAERAGVAAGDVILAVDGVPVDALNLQEASNRLRGRAGTTVTVKVRRTGVAEPLEFSLERSNVLMHSVQSALLEPGYGYVRILNFSETTDTDLKDSVTALKAASPQGNLKGLVIDLRNNPGGVLEAAVNVADAFIDSGVIVTADGRAPEAKFKMDATPGDMLDGAPLVVLVNHGSASASEILAGALKDHHRAVLIGRTTYGKGSVQTVLPLADDRGAIKLTTSRYYTPSGKSIQETGITPDIVVEKEQRQKDFTPGSSRALLQGDAQIALALSKLKEGAVLPQGESGKP